MKYQDITVSHKQFKRLREKKVQLHCLEGWFQVFNVNSFLLDFVLVCMFLLEILLLDHCQRVQIQVCCKRFLLQLSQEQLLFQLQTQLIWSRLRCKHKVQVKCKESHQNIHQVLIATDNLSKKVVLRIYGQDGVQMLCVILLLMLQNWQVMININNGQSEVDISKMVFLVISSAHHGQDLQPVLSVHQLMCSKRE